jgi:DNA-binding PadR family transcriptional regulator
MKLTLTPAGHHGRDQEIRLHHRQASYGDHRCVYRDSMDYVYQTLGRMVKAGLIKRTGPGVFGPKGGEL